VSEYIRVARVGEVGPGEMKRVGRAGEWVLLLNVAGRYFAVSDLCPHEEAPMHLGYLKGFHLHCPLHGSYFDVRSGRVLADPAEHDLPCYRVRVEGEDILVGPPAGT
jgi:nitrite reductase/ring-hydroxylating ferredoxin subunit